MSYDNSPQGPGAVVPVSLSAGEIACLEWVSSGLGSKEIARKLDISPHTVDARLKAACRKLGTKSRFVAAKILEEAHASAGDLVAEAGDTSLVYEILDLPSDAGDGDKRPSAGEGDGLDDLEHGDLQQPESRRDSGPGRHRLELSRPIANFFGGENRLSIWQRIAIILMITMGAGLTFGVLLNGFAGVSQLMSSL
ncbi:helix-turn-helix domain-containing protein [Sphingopyxis panaciterrulae]|uniref:DNA-binding CsgD family transcriptional regulator n=1 Tax=Sphingopyxis panaciterrulae TaxID=462372 RepID=A0A7W9B7I0_9SPHN|nr:helix-turn-helix transcriptional regulator [Sphingopyxis panaciterrulae]MBB5707663.1 DNA-binding CsgD family transcriptional regulator [Sphingopyxis panaciterrulae]